MARETAAQRAVRFEAEHEERLSKEVAEYPQRLMTLLTRSVADAFDLTVSDNKFRVEDRNNSVWWNLAYAHSSESQERLEDLEYTLDRKDTEAAEAKRKDELARTAFNKLSKEEQQALGLSSRFNW